MNPLSKQQQSQLHQQLLELQHSLAEIIALAKASADTVTLDQTKVGRLSRMDAIQQQAMAQANCDGAQQSLKNVRLAISLMAQGDYGYCASCGNDIAFARLKIKPESTLCLECQHHHEQS